jgi:hypothetical protein
MRYSCLTCVRKHLTQAIVLLCESEKDPELYGWHRYLACGHMAEAEDECIALYKEMAVDIRKYRILIDERKECTRELWIWFEKMIKDLTKLIDKENR